eukprot:1158817-Pelagomonas_calceolata.AAC.7
MGGVAPGMSAAMLSTHLSMGNLDAMHTNLQAERLKKATAMSLQQSDQRVWVRCAGSAGKWNAMHVGKEVI